MAAFVFAASAVACSAAMDSSGADSFGGADGTTTPSPGSDAGTTAFGGGEDASVASASKYNLLCHTGTGSSCIPDDTAPPVSNVCGLGLDAGVGITPPTDGGVYDAGPSPIACHVAVDPTSASGDSAPVCTASGTGGNGAQCLGSSDCAAGFECVGSPGVCREYCCALPGTCGANFFCDVQEETSAGSVKVPVCEPVQPCNLMGDTMCGVGETCGIVNDDDGTTSCVSAGPADVGNDCDDTHCKQDLVCLGDVGSKKCLALCEKKHPNCDSGQTCTGAAPLFQGENSGVGVCQ
ncbi:MAG: hypothetical protein ABI183_16480 [Polyangiaceae bacterium]